MSKKPKHDQTANVVKPDGSNEEGRIKGMAPNPLASTMARVSLVGPVVFGHRSILR